jgi:ATP-dependent helicase/nuclease subunit B
MTIVARPRVYSIAAGTPFVDALAAGLLARHGDDPLTLSSVLVLLPTRRACRSLREAFLRRGGGQPMLLPAMRPLGDVDEDELTLSAADQLDLPPAIPELRRLLLLTRLVQSRGEHADPAQAARLAAELARLLDQIETERLGFAALADLVPQDFAEHWQITLDFLKILTENWPKILDAEGMLDPADRRNRLLAATARRWQVDPPDHPVYAAGSTGSIPATAELLRTVAYLPQGAVILPGFDAAMDADSWAALADDPAHPQFGMKQLLAGMLVDRAEVEPWSAPSIAAAVPGRAALIREALRPAATTDAWSSAPAIDAGALDGIARIDAAGPREEAEIIALLLREALETPGRTAALVTPDRDLARRVAATLRRWNVAIDDSAGVPLADTPPGALLRLSAAMLASEAAPVPLLAALKHPLAAGGGARDDFRRSVRRLERKVLHGPRPAPGFAGIKAALHDRQDKDSEALSRWLDRLAARAEPLAALLRAPSVPLPDMLAAHVAFAEWLAAADDGVTLWAGDAGEAIADFVAELAQAADAAAPMPGAAWPGLLDVLLSGRAVRPRYGLHPRLAIWGPLEARLQQADLLILGGLNEGTWPADPGADPWMSRPMRARFGLPPLERRIGLAAHDFQQAVMAREVVLTRAEKVEGAPTVPSRWLLRLETLLQGMERTFDPARAAKLRQWQSKLDEPRSGITIQPPAPMPPVSVRPRELSVTRIETWVRDPYAIYARHILKLQPLEPLDADPGAAERGTIIHLALEEFVRAYPDVLPADAAARLTEIGRQAFGQALARPGVRAFWWPRFLDIVAWFIADENVRRADGTRTLVTEGRGAMELAGSAGRFLLTAKADRIDRDASGRLIILDYKTGMPPSEPQIASGLAPQLPLEAAIALAGGFENVPAAEIAELAFVRLRGGSEPGERIPLKKHSPAELAARAVAGLTKLVTMFDRAGTPYRSRPRPQFIGRFGEYDHLARVKEWSAGEAGEP